jgi:TatD family hydrolase
VFRNFDADLDAVAQRWRDAGVRALVHACVEPAEIPAIRALADRFPELRYSVGVHPLDTQHWTPDCQDVLRAAAQADARVVAIGELGLDLFREQNLAEQLAVLRPQLDLACELDLPVIIHCRDAAEPMLAELRQRAGLGACPRGVMHCWGGTPEEMAGFLELGFYISFSGVVTFPKAAHARCRPTAIWWRPTAPFWPPFHGGASATSPPTWPRWPPGWPNCAAKAWRRCAIPAPPTLRACSAYRFTLYDDPLVWKRIRSLLSTPAALKRVR